MDADTVAGWLDATMRRLGFTYAWENGFVSLTAGLGGRRWKMAVKCMEDKLAFYAAYPRQIPYQSRTRMLEFLNTLTASSDLGGWFLLKTEQGYVIVCRCDVLIPDEYSITDSIENGLKQISAKF